MELVAGLTGCVQAIVTDADTAVALGSGDVAVLGTPRVLALAEAATVAATAGHLDPGSTSVGTRIQLDHQAPTVVGRHVEAVATLAAIDGRRLIFDIVVRDGEQRIAEGRVERVLVNTERFVQRAAG